MVETYDKTLWVDETEPAICAENLNNIENGIYNATVGINAEESARTQAVATEKTRATNAESLVQSNVNQEVSRATNAENRKVNKPSSNGTNGQFLKTLGNGQTEWATPSMPSDQQIEDAVDDWLDAHPEAVTTVQDGAITPVKLNIDLLKAYEKSGTAMVYYPSLETGGYSGSTALMVVEGKTVLFDASPTVNKTATLDYYESLYNAGLFSNIDFIVISHFHWDHIQCLEDILAEFPHANCHAYIPMDPDGYYLGDDASTISTNRTNVIDTLENYNVTYTEISEETTVTIVDGLCEIDLFNSDADAYNNYKTVSPNVYNNYSMVSLVKVGDIFAMFPGDIQVKAQQYIMSVKDLPRLFLYTVHHHGIQNDDDITFLDTIEPEWCIIQTNHTRGLVSAASALASNYSSSHLGSCGYSSYEFAIQKDSGSIIGGYDVERSGWYYSYIDLYVDNEYTGTIHNGTQTYPFTDINEPNMFIKNNRNLHYRIHVKATLTPYDLLWIRDMPLSIEYVNVSTNDATKPTVNGLYIKNSQDISFSNFIFQNGRTTNNIYSIGYIASSVVVFADCDFFGDGKAVSPSHYALQNGISSVYVTNSSFKDVYLPFVAYRYGEFITNKITVSDVWSVYHARTLQFVIRGIDVLGSNVDYYINTANDHSLPVDISIGSTAETRTAFESLISKNQENASSNPFRYRDSYGRTRVMQIIGKSVVEVGNPYVPTDSLASISLNTITTMGFYVYASSCTNKPTNTTSGGVLLVVRYSDSYFTQIAFVNTQTDNNLYIRKYKQGNFADWAKLEGTII